MATRADGREPDELRRVAIVYERLDRSDGSARFSFGPSSYTRPSSPLTRRTGQTSALAALIGPAEVRPQHELPSGATFDVQLRPLSGLPSPSSRALAHALRGALAPSISLGAHPRALLQLSLQALSPGAPPPRAGPSAGAPDARAFHPALQAACANAGSAALLAAGAVRMRGVVLAAGVGRLRAPGPARAVALVLDPAEAELARCEGGGCFAFLFAGAGEDGDVPPARCVWESWARWEGAGADGGVPATGDELAEARALALEGARAVWRTLKASIADMDGPRAPLVQKPAAHTSTKPPPAAAAPAEDADFEDEMEEVADEDDARMEI
jgi:exosome complex component RRP46